MTDPKPNGSAKAVDLGARIKHKIVFLGNQYVGKTSIIERYIYNVFDDSTQPTVGIDFLAKTVKVDDKSMRLSLWDTAGQERFHSLIPSYLRDASCAIIVYDITSMKSFDGVESWYQKVRSTRGNEALIVLMANKIDQIDKREVPSDVAKQFASERELLYLEVSAKESTFIEEAFQQICHNLPVDNSFLITQSQFINQSQFEATSNRQMGPQVIQPKQTQIPQLMPKQNITIQPPSSDKAKEKQNTMGGGCC